MTGHIKIILSLSALLAVTCLSAQPLASEGLAADARTAGFAGVSVAMDAHSMSLFNNMAATGFADPRFSTQASYGLSALSNGNYLHSVGGYFRLNDKHSFAAGARYLSFDKIENTQDGIEYTTVSPYDLMIDLAYARRLNDYLSLSINARFVNSKLNEGYGFKTASSVAVDLGILYRRDVFSVGATVSNLGMLLDYGIVKYRMPASVNAGGAYRWKVDDGHLVTGLAEVRYNFMPEHYRFASGGVGAEYMFREMVAVRGGYYLASETRAAGNYGSVGAGIYLGPVAVDFAWNLAAQDSPMHNIWRVTAGVRF